MPAQNIFAQFAEPMKSVTDYQADYDAQDLRKEQLAGERRTNAIAALTQQQSQQAMARNALVQAAQRKAAETAGGDETVYARNLRLSGFPELIDPADKVDKAATERGKAKSENAKRDTETENAVVTMWRDMIGNAANPQQAAQMVTAMHSDPRIANTPIARVPLEQGLQMLQQVPFDQWKQQFALGAAKFVEMNKPTYQQQNLGGNMQTLALPGLGGAPTVANTAPITQSRDNIANNETQRRGQNMVDARSRESTAVARETAAAQLSKPFEVTGPNGAPMLVQQTKDGRIVPVQGFAPKSDNPTKIADAKEAIALLNQADPLLKGSTGSGVGQAVDAVAGWFGAATPGSIKAQELKAIEGALIAKMPKMSGPQSDKDVLLYRQMAGLIGDPSVPYERKAAAANTVREIQERYAGMVPGSSKPAAPKNAKGWMLHTDANGNKAYVSPDGKQFEEAK